MSLDDSLKGVTANLGLSDLSDLGVDLIDIGGDEVATLHIGAGDATAVAAESLEFAANDHIVLDLGVDTTVDYAGGLNRAVQTATGLNLTDLRDLGIDTIDIAGKDVADAHINVADAEAMGAAGLTFAATDTISLDVTADELGGSGTYLGGDMSLDEALETATGLTLADLKELGVDFIDIGGSGNAATLHLLESDEEAWVKSGLTLGEGDKFIFDLDPLTGGSAPSTADAKTASSMVEVDNGVSATEQQDTDFVLGEDQSLQDLLVALGDSGVVSDEMSDSQDLPVPVAVGAEADIAVSDSTVSTLLDAGMLSVDTASTIEVDTDAEHMSTSLLQLVDIGTDKVVTSQDKVFVDLGEVTDLDQLSELLSSLVEDSSDSNFSTLFVQADGDMVQEVGLVFTADQAALAAEIDADTSLLAQLTHVGITELLVATDDGAKGDVQMLGHEYHKQPIA